MHQKTVRCSISAVQGIADQECVAEHPRWGLVRLLRLGLLAGRPRRERLVPEPLRRVVRRVHPDAPQRRRELALKEPPVPDLGFTK